MDLYRLGDYFDSDDSFYNRSDPCESVCGSDGGDDGEYSVCRSPRSPDDLAREECVSEHTVLLTSKGRACPVGRDHHGQCTIPVLADGVIYTHVATGGDHTVLLKSDGGFVALGRNIEGQCDIPTLVDGVAYTQVAAGRSHTVLLTTDGTVVACGSNVYGECDIPACLSVCTEQTEVSVAYRIAKCGVKAAGHLDIPALADDLVYTQVAIGGGSTITSGGFTVLLKSDGTAVACGHNDMGQCDIPALPRGVAYIEVAAGWCHTVLLKTDGSVSTCGSNKYKQCDIPVLPKGVTWTSAAAGDRKTFLLASDGTVKVCGVLENTHCVVPTLARGVIYTCIVATQTDHAVLMRSDGVAVICGSPPFGLPVLPILPEGDTFVRALGYILLMLHFFDSHAALCVLGGDEVCRIDIGASDTLIDVRRAFMQALLYEYLKFCVLLPSGEFLNKVCAETPSARIESYVVRKRAKRN